MVVRNSVLRFAAVLVGATAFGASTVNLAFSTDTTHTTDSVEAAAGAISLDDCRAIWNLAAGRSDLGRDQAKPYVPDFAAVDVNGDGKITNAEFRAGCAKGLVHKARRAD